MQITTEHVSHNTKKRQARTCLFFLRLLQDLRADIGDVGHDGVGADTLQVFHFLSVTVRIR